MKMKKLTFNEFCFEILDGLYDPNFEYDEQSTGYKQLRYMVENNIEPASLEEIKRWETKPTYEELIAIPHVKYLRGLHELVRPFIIENWNEIKKLEL